MKRRYFRIVIAGIIFILALLLTLYPVISNIYNQRHQSLIHTAYEEVLQQADTQDLERIRELAIAYNEAIVPGTAEEAYVLCTQRVYGRLLSVVQADHSHLPDGIHADDPAVPWDDDLPEQYASGIGCHAGGKRSTEDCSTVRFGLFCPGEYEQRDLLYFLCCEPCENRIQAETGIRRSE